MLAVVYGIKQIAQDGMGWPPALSIMAGPGRRRRVRPPATEDCLPGARPEDVPGTAFSASLAANTLGFFIAFGTELFIAQYLQLVLGLSPLQAGLWSLPSAVGFIVGAMLTPVIVRRVRPAFAMAAGLGLAAVGYAIISQVDGTAALTVLVTGRRVLAGPDAADHIGDRPDDRRRAARGARAAAGLSETSSEFGGALGIAVLGSIGTAVYRHGIAAALPAGIPPESGAAARDSLGGALAVAGQLPNQFGAALLDTAHESFTDGLHLTAVISAVIAGGVAVLVAALLGRTRGDSQADRRH